MQDVSLHACQSNAEQSAGARESLQAFLVFLIPLLLAIPLYLRGFLSEASAYYLLYGIYIVGAIAVTKANGRGLHEIGLSRRNLGGSLLMCSGLILGQLAGRLHSGAHIAPGLTVSLIGQQLLFNFLFSGPSQEILFRGLMLFSLCRWKGPRVALVVSSVLFGMVHLRMGMGYVFGTAVIGAVYGYVTYKTKNVVGPMIVHGLYNFLFDFFLIS